MITFKYYWRIKLHISVSNELILLYCIPNFMSKIPHDIDGAHIFFHVKLHKENEVSLVKS